MYNSHCLLHKSFLPNTHFIHILICIPSNSVDYFFCIVYNFIYLCLETKKSLHNAMTFFLLYQPGYHLLSHTVSHAVPSAVIGLTILFGMGRGVTQKHIITRCMLSQNLRFCHETALIRTYVRRSFLFVNLTSDFLTTISLKECSFKIAYK